MRNSDNQSERAKARWSILREALLVQHAPDRASSKVSTDRSSNKYKTHPTEGSIPQEVNKHSIHKFPGFQMIDRRSTHDHEHYELIIEDGYEIIEYEIPIQNMNSAYTTISCNTGQHLKNTSSVLVRTKERKLNESKISLDELTSHVHFGVDNTGNTRVWDSSNVLTFLVMGEKKIPNSRIPREDVDNDENDGRSGDLLCSTNAVFIGMNDILSLATVKSGDSNANANENDRKTLRVLELGSGMAGLPSLALSMLNSTSQQNETEIKIDVTITDGHPKAVENNVACSKLTHQSDSNNDTTNTSNIQCCPLLWKVSKAGAKECLALMRNSIDHASNSSQNQSQTSNIAQTPIPFDLVLVSDCTHFTDFHADLAATIGRVLRVGGVCILCQPRRGSSLSLFIDLLHSVNGKCDTSSNGDGIEKGNGNAEQNPLFQIDLHKDYHQEISHSHQLLIKDSCKNEFYEPNLHYPLLLILKKMREYNEEIDTRHS